jgi:acyl carrier protein phosphodiesterase
MMVGGNIMKKIIVLTLILCGVCSAYSQITQEMYDNKVEENVNLKNQIKSEQDKTTVLSDAYKKDTLALQKKLKELNTDLSRLKKIKDDWKNLEGQLKTKSDSIALLKNQLLEKDGQIATTRQQGNQKALEEKEKGKAEALADVVKNYKRQFDDLIKSSTKESVLRDMQLVDNNAEVKPILDDLLIYFDATELLAKKFNDAQIKNIQTKLNQITQKSVLLDKLKENVESYQDFYTEFKATIGKIVALDIEKPETIDESKTKKSEKIIIILTKYMYDYYDYGNYHYLSEIILEIIKRKRDADADIKELFNNL